MLTVATLGGCAAPDPPPPLTVMSFNVRYGTADDGENSWPYRRDLVWEVVERTAPDVLGVQEALRFQLDELHAALPGYVEIGVGRDDGAEAGEYAAILIRDARLRVVETGTFWLSDTPTVPGSTSWGNRITRICTWARLEDRRSGRLFSVYNVHLDHESQPSREASARLLADRLASRPAGEPAIVLGDFNAGEDNPARRLLTATGAIESEGDSLSSPALVDSYRLLRPPSDGEGTFNGFAGDTTGERIDAILVSGDWMVLGATIDRIHRDGLYPSDHFPVTAVLGIAPPP
jgi:endonuclease/exonuclease/phosphatase family metal-dependent hydrolase